MGERGPELITPKAAGYVHTAERTARMLNAGIPAEPSNGMFRSAEPSASRDLFAGERIRAGGPSADAGASGQTINAPVHIGTVNYGSPEGRADFEAELRAHRSQIAAMVAEENRQRGRRAF